ncbi:hypothetical protein [Meiothermus sp.]|uniref:TapB family protein n=1 Tax=Meiothermus sp. TaxID=1955249 RepID=UPI00307E5F85
MRKLLVVSMLLLGSLAWARCDHPFFPVREGWVWSYRSSPDNSTHTASIIKVSDKGFVQRLAFKDFSFDIRWACDAKGLTQLEYFQPPSNQGIQINLKTRKVSGVVIPQGMRVGTTWSYGYEVAGEAKQPNMTLQVEQTMSVVSKVVGQESVSVPAGRFSAYKVESTMTIRGSMKSAGQSMPMNFDVKTTSWYAQGVGLVKTQSEGVTVEFLSLKR